jgi:hypothetical protein
MANRAHIHVAQIEPGCFLAVSIDSPRFGVSASSKEEAVAKAERARIFFNENKHSLLSIQSRETVIVEPAFEVQELCPA